MKLILIGLFSLFVQNPNQRDLKTGCESFQNLNTRIRDGKIKKDKALPLLIAKINEIKYLVGSTNSAASKWTFPLAGYDKRAIGGKTGNGYIPKGYDFFDGNKHGGHPAHDIFIADKNQDCKDDKSGQKVEVKSVLSGIVIDSETSWKPGSNLRGGKYVRVFHPNENLIAYYAHLDSVIVEIGQTVNSGDQIGLLGRTKCI